MESSSSRRVKWKKRMRDDTELHCARYSIGRLRDKVAKRAVGEAAGEGRKPIALTRSRRCTRWA